jgi:protein-disulfide isomerase
MENTTKQKVSTPIAIIVAGVLIMVGILLTRGGGTKTVVAKTLSEQVGVSKAQLTQCTNSTDTATLGTKIQASVEAAMKDVPADQRGTPYSVIVGTNGAKTEIRGADTIDNVKKLVAEVTAGKVTTKYTGNVPPVDPTTDHIFGNPGAPVTIIEYSDFECPYCARFEPILEQVVNDSNGGVNWVFRNWPIHNSITKLIAAECVAKLKGNDAYWKYSDLLFKLLTPTQAPAADNL